MKEPDQQTLARLLLSIKPPKGAPKKRRPLTPIQVARYLQDWIEQTSKDEVAKRLGLKRTEMLREFLSLLHLPPDVQTLFEDWKVGIDKGYRISLLDAADDQRKVARAILEHNLTSSDVRDIVSLKKMNPEMPIEECIRKVVASKKKVKYYVVLTGIDEDTLLALQRRCKQCQCQVKDLIRKLIQEILTEPNGIIELEMRGKLIKITLTPTAFKDINEKAKQLNVILDDLVDKLARDWLCGKR